MIKRLLLVLLCVTLLTSCAVWAESPAPSVSPAPSATPAPDAEDGLPEILSKNGILCLVNKNNKIGAYEPDDLTLPRVKTRKKSLEESIYMRREAARALETMFEAAMLEKQLVLYATSGYRPYGIQQVLFNRSVAERGRERTLRTIAVPGSSEHQTGLAMDVQSPNFLQLGRAFEDTAEGQWVRDNAHRFGFIIRYPDGKKDVTGIAYEPWHLRYLGVAHAKAVHSLGLAYEEYFPLIKQLPAYVLEGATDLLLADVANKQLKGETPPSFEDTDDLGRQQAILREATLPLLASEQSYEQVLWAIYPTPRPTSAPRVDLDEEESLFKASP